MEPVKIVTLKSSEWRQYRDLRLRALKEEPQAYSSTYEENTKNPDSYWIKRLDDALQEASQWLSFAKQIPALDLYQSLGFKVIKKYRMILGDGNEHECYDLEMKF